MDAAFVIRGKFTKKAFVSDDPMPDVEGPAELIVYPQDPRQKKRTGESMFGSFGKALQLRSAKDIDRQLQDERDSWQKQ